MFHDNTAEKNAGVASAKAVDITDVMIESARAAATHFGVCAELHESDQLLGYFINRMGMEEKSAAISYIDGGHHDAISIVKLKERLGMANSPYRVLEFASGFGRVTRHLKVLSPNDNLVASDIHQEACEFIANKIGVVSKVSSINPANLDVGSEYDLIFVLSLFSHLPSKTFGLWLEALYRLLAPGGYLMFTTHGQTAIEKGREYFGTCEYEEPGFAYRRDSDQTDLDGSDYGTAVALPNYLTKLVALNLPDATLTSFRAGIWFGMQDEWVLRKPLDSN